MHAHTYYSLSCPENNLPRFCCCLSSFPPLLVRIMEEYSPLGVWNPCVPQRVYCCQTVKNGRKSMKIAMKHHQTIISMTKEKKRKKITGEGITGP